MQAFCEFFNLKFVRAQCIVCHVASLAQLVEHLICNQRVVGSSPTTGTRIKNIRKPILVSVFLFYNQKFIKL